jgi:hypothetical protein
MLQHLRKWNSLPFVMFDYQVFSAYMYFYARWCTYKAL